MKRLFTLSLISIMLFMFMQTTFAIAGGSFKEIRNGMIEKQVIDILGQPKDIEVIVAKEPNMWITCIPIYGIVYLWTSNVSLRLSDFQISNPLF